MKRLYLLRHSKAGQTNKNISEDHDRKLTKMGEAACLKVAAYYSKNFKDNAPDIIICSSAMRARQTANLIKKHFEIKKDVELDMTPKLYLANPDDILNVIRLIPSKYTSALIVGHAPSLHDFAVGFAGKGDKEKFRLMRSNFPPASTAVFDVDKKSWKEFERNSGNLVDFISAKKLK
jgi:phosphohistidine phosphatase